MVYAGYLSRGGDPPAATESGAHASLISPVGGNHMSTSQQPQSVPGSVFGPVVRRAREQRGLGVRALARAAGLSPGSVRDCERGRHAPTRATVEKLADGLGLDAHQRQSLLVIAGHAPAWSYWSWLRSNIQPIDQQSPLPE